MGPRAGECFSVNSTGLDAKTPADSSVKGREAEPERGKSRSQKDAS